MDEIERVIQTYKQRHVAGLDEKYPKFSAFQHHNRAEREYWLDFFLTRHFEDFENLRFLEIGAGHGGNLSSFFRLGIKRENVFANELISERAQKLLLWLPENNVDIGDARNIQWRGFDVIYQSMVFTSILSDDVRRDLAKVLWWALKPGGLLLWYDMLFNNPKNPDIRGIKLKEVCELFPQATVASRRITLAPPIGRRVGRFYPFLNFPFLRTHTLSALKKPL